MKNPIKRILAATLCAAVTAVNFSIGEIKAPVTVTANAVEAADGTNGTEPSNSIFNERDDSTVGNSTAEDIAIRRADPYTTTDSNGNSKRWASLAVVPEICASNGDSAYVVDYVNGEESSYFKSNYRKFDRRLKALTGINVFGQKDNGVAELGYVSLADMKKSLDDGAMLFEEPDDIADICGLFLSVMTNDREISSLHIGLAEELAYLDKVPQNQKGPYLAVAAGDFDGDGRDTVITYIPHVQNPSIKAYEIAEYGDEYGYTHNDIVPGQYVSSNVYADFNLTQVASSTDEAKTRNVPLVDIIAADVDKDGCDELIVTAGLGNTTTANGSNTVMKIYDLVNGRFEASYTQELSGTYNGQQGRIRWASSAAGNIIKDAQLGIDFPEIITAGWVDTKGDAGISMQKRLGVHITELTGLTAQGNTYVGTYQQKTTLGTSTGKISAAGDEGVSQFLRDGFPTSNTGNRRHDLLAVGTLAYKGPGEVSGIMLGDTVYDFLQDTNKLSAVHWNSDTTFKSYGVRTLLTGYYDLTAKNETENAGFPESACFLAVNSDGKYAAFTYCFNNGTWTTKKLSDTLIKTDPGIKLSVSICNVDVDDDGVYVKLKDVVKIWADPKPLYILEAAPYFREFPSSQGSTGIGYSHENGQEIKWNASISAAIEVYFKQEISFFVKAGEVGAGASISTSVTYEGSKSMSQSIEL